MTKRTPHHWSDIQRNLTEQKPVNIVDAIIDVNTELRNSTISRDFVLRNCVVRGPLILNFVTFAESLSFIDTVFEDGIDLSGCSVLGRFINERVEFRNTARFDGFSVSGHAYFAQTRFTTRPDFQLTTWGPLTVFSGTKLEDGGQFQNATFGGNVRIDESQTRDSSIDFTFATIKGMLRVADSNFEGPLLLSRVRTSGAIQFTNDTFGESARLDLSKARIEGELEIENCKFSNTAGNILMDSLRLGGGCFIRAVECRGSVQIRDAGVESYFALQGLKHGTQDEADKSKFDGEFSLSGTRVGRFFICYDSIFTGQNCKDNAGQIIDLTGLRVDDDTLVLGCDFQNGAKFNRSQFNGIFGTDSRYGGEVDFQGVQFSSAVRFLEPCVFEEGADFYFCNFDGEASFGGASIHHHLSLQQCEFRRSLRFVLARSDEVVKCFRDDARLYLGGTSYQSIVPVSAIEDLIARMPNIPEEDASLALLEHWLRLSAATDDADLTRYERFKRRGKRLAWRRKQRMEWAWNRVYWASTFFGTIVWPVLLIALLFGSATLFVAKLPWLSSSTAGIVQKVCGVVAAVALALGIEPVKRRLWPQ